MHPQQYQRGSTIAAIASPPGNGAIAIVRISGPDAISIAAKVFSGPVTSYPSHSVHHGMIQAADGATIDQVLLIVFRAPRSYTGEESVEIHCHGGALITQKVLNRILEAGARMALPGEFTFQAFINHKLDLAQAEAVQLLISSQNELARQSAAQQLEGALSSRIVHFQEELTRIAAILEAWVDFPEEGLEFASIETTTAQLERMHQQMLHLIQTYDDGQRIHEGASLCLIGSPNVGKSSLMNALLGKDRAIVTPIPGTTRDFIEETLRIGSIHFRLIDTAGIHSSQDLVEQEGMRRSLAAMEKADLILFVLDASRLLSIEDRELIASLPQNQTILIWNKMDISSPPEKIAWESIVHLSAKEGSGLDILKETINRMIWKNGPPTKDEVVLTSSRHRQALKEAALACETVITGLRENLSPEFIAFDMRSCLHHLGSIIGTNVSEDILHSIFSQFCVGK